MPAAKVAMVRAASAIAALKLPALYFCDVVALCAPEAGGWTAAAGQSGADDSGAADALQLHFIDVAKSSSISSSIVALAAMGLQGEACIAAGWLRDGEWGEEADANIFSPGCPERFFQIHWQCGNSAPPPPPPPFLLLSPPVL
jgi:hypothetical protein